jgi:hypothetical protein
VSADEHYFEFQSKFDPSTHKRLCARCQHTYDNGSHIEITTLKPYTNYVCPTGGGYGHSGIYTGALPLELRNLRQHLCICGAEFVEEDLEKWKLSWEMSSDFGRSWHPVSVVRSRHAASEQHRGLLELVAEGEAIRNVELVALNRAKES